jgi:hypothetical protein
MIINIYIKRNNFIKIYRCGRENKCASFTGLYNGQCQGSPCPFNKKEIEVIECDDFLNIDELEFIVLILEKCYEQYQYNNTSTQNKYILSIIEKIESYQQKLKKG